MKSVEERFSLKPLSHCTRSYSDITSLEFKAHSLQSFQICHKLHPPCLDCHLDIVQPAKQERWHPCGLLFTFLYSVATLKMLWKQTFFLRHHSAPVAGGGNVHLCQRMVELELGHVYAATCLLHHCVKSCPAAVEVSGGRSCKSVIRCKMEI